MSVETSRSFRVHFRYQVLRSTLHHGLGPVSLNPIDRNLLYVRNNQTFLKPSRERKFLEGFLLFKLLEKNAHRKARPKNRKQEVLRMIRMTTLDQLFQLVKSAEQSNYRRTSCCTLYYARLSQFSQNAAEEFRN